MLSLESLASVAFLGIAGLVCGRGDINVAVNQAAFAQASTQALRAFAVTIVKTSHNFDAVNMRDSFVTGRTIREEIARVIGVRIVRV
jgi:hypothetical protein